MTTSSGWKKMEVVKKEEERRRRWGRRRSRRRPKRVERFRPIDLFLHQDQPAEVIAPPDGRRPSSHTSNHIESIGVAFM